MNQKNQLGLNKCFLDLDDPFELFGKWFDEAKKKEINDPNALALGTANKDGIPSVRMVLLKSFDKKGFVFNPIKWSWALSDRDLSVNYVTASLNEGEK